MMDTSNASKDAVKNQISCELCQRRKVRCDKGNPCSTCQRVGVKCEVSSRQRLPRGRNGGRRKGEMDLKARIAKLENLVSSLGGNESSPATASTQDHGQGLSEPAARKPSSDMSRYIGGSFWNSLTTEVNGLREILDESSDSETDTPEQSELSGFTPPSVTPRSFNFVLCGPDSFMMAPNALEHPPIAMIELLHDYYFSNVDPIFKVLHKPSVTKLMLGGKPYLGHEADDPAVDALRFAFYYAAINTQEEHQCKQNFGDNKDNLLNKYRFALEVCLARADFVNSTKIEVLQALIIFLASVRLNDHSRWVWTILALIVRMAEALGLHIHSASSTLRPFDQEMRHRLWHEICVLDIHSAFDRGTELLINDHYPSNLLPLNVNDTDLFPDMDALPPSREDFTIVSFCLMSNIQNKHAWGLVTVSKDSKSGDFALSSWHQKQEVVAEFASSVNKYVRHCNPEIPFHSFAMQVGEIMCDNLMLFAIRPMRFNPRSEAPRVEGPKVLSLSIKILEKHRTLMTTPGTEPWRWFVWVEWHPLAVAMAELCSQTEGPLVERAWRVVDEAFEQHSETVADTKTGMLWQPIKKLLKKAKQNRRAAQMAKLSLGNENQSYARQPMPAFDTDLPPGLPPDGLNRDANFNAKASRDDIGQAGIWDNGLLAPGSMDSSVQGQLLSENVYRPSDPDFNGFSFDSAWPIPTQQPGGSQDMAWIDWEAFIGDVNFQDSEMPDLAEGSSRQA